MKDYSSNLAYIDMLFNLLIGFVSLFILAFMMINPPAQEGKIDPKTQIMITLEWEESSRTDIDIWVLGPTGNPVGFSMKENGYIVLDRDDLGMKNDTFIVNGVSKTIERNIENGMVNDIVPGEYFVNVHYFSPSGESTHPTIRIFKINPFEISFERQVTLEPKQEKTVVSFMVTDDGDIVGISTHINKRIKVTTQP